MTVPEVIIHKKRKNLEKKGQSIAKALKRGGINWEPPYPEGKDEQSMAIHRQYLKNEIKKRSPDWEKIKRRMALTYPDRRRMINGKQPLTEIKEEYPALFCYSEVSRLLSV